MERLSGTLGVFVGVAATLAALVVTGLIVVYTGAFNVAASEGHLPITRWAFDKTYHNSVSGRAAKITEPRFTAAMVQTGATEYKEYCQHCHAGPGVERDEWATGMLPRPPHLTEAAPEWGAREVFWIVKHGIKMSGMPAFGDTESDETIWNIVAFVKQLPAMTPQQYQAFGGPGGHSHGSSPATPSGRP